MKTKIIIEAEMTDEQCEALVCEITRTAEVCGIELSNYPHKINLSNEDIYHIAKSWLEKDHDDSSVDWVKLMADDLHRRIS